MADNDKEEDVAAADQLREATNYLLRRLDDLQTAEHDLEEALADKDFVETRKLEIERELEEFHQDPLTALRDNLPLPLRKIIEIAYLHQPREVTVYLCDLGLRKLLSEIETDDMLEKWRGYRRSVEKAVRSADPSSTSE